MLTQAALAGAERALALAISRDPLTARRLQSLEGRLICIEGTSPTWRVYLAPVAGGIALRAVSEEEPDCSLKAPSALLAQLVLGSDRQRLLQDPDVCISGDSPLLISLQQIMGDLQIDGEGELARWIGPVAAHAIGNLLRTGRDWGRQAHDSLSLSLNDYLTEETRQLVGTAEGDAFAARLHQLRLQLDRLDARVQNLENPAPDTPTE
jgi:ubiquinone biosynthesis accessory factor UbiJ